MENKTIYSLLLLAFLLGLLLGFGLNQVRQDRYISDLKVRLDNIDNTMYTMALAQSYLSNNTIKCFELNNMFNKKEVDWI